MAEGTLLPSTLSHTSSETPWTVTGMTIGWCSCDAVITKSEFVGEALRLSSIDAVGQLAEDHHLPTTIGIIAIWPVRVDYTTILT